MQSVTDKLRNIVKETVEKSGYEFVDLIYGKRGRNWHIQVFADKEGGVTVADCAAISRSLGFEFEKEPELISHSYNLEVSSPGLDRPLRSAADFKRFSGRDFVLKLYQPLDGSRKWSGTVVDVTENGELVFDDEKGHRRIVGLDLIASANLEVKI